MKRTAGVEAAYHRSIFLRRVEGRNPPEIDSNEKKLKEIITLLKHITL